MLYSPTHVMQQTDTHDEHRKLIKTNSHKKAPENNKRTAENSILKF